MYLKLVYLLLFAAVGARINVSAGNAASGDGTMSVSPTSATAGSTGNSFTYSFRNSSGNAFSANSYVQVIVPAGWSAPQTSSSATAGFVSATAVNTAGVGTVSVSGTGPWTINVVMTSCAGGTGNGFNLTYAGTAGVTVPTTAGAVTFTTGSHNNTGGTVTTLSAGSPSITINAAAANKLAFTTQPGGGTGGTAWSTQPVVKVQDQYGNTVTGSSASITLAITGGTPATGGPGTFSATVNPLAASSGIATFAGAKIDKPGTGYQLTATSSGLTSATSSTFDIAVGPAAKLAFTTQPSAGTAGVAWATQPVVTIQDAGGNTISSDTSTVTLAIQVNPGSGTLSGTVSKAAVAGVADFSASGLSINKAGTGYTIRASDGALTVADSSTFNIVPAAAAKLVVTTQPSARTLPSTAFATQPVVQIQDAFGNVITTGADATRVVTVTLTTGSGTLGGTTTTTAVAGVASFAGLGLNINTRGSGKVLSFTTTGGVITSTTSSPFNIGDARYAVNAASAAWNVTSTWSAASGGSSGASVPVDGDDVFIADVGTARTVTIPISYSAACSSLSLGNNNNAVAGVLNFTDGTSTLTVNGNFAMSRPTGNSTTTIGLGAGQMTVSGSLEMAKNADTSTAGGRLNTITISTGILTIGGDLIFSAEAVLQNQIVFSGAGTLNLGGNFTGTLGTLTPSTGTVNFNSSTVAQTIPIGVSSITYNNINVNNTSSSGATLSTTVSATLVTGNITVQTGKLSNGGFAIVGGGTKTFQVNNGATFAIGGSTNGMVTGFGTRTFQATSTVSYEGTGAQAVSAETYGSLSLSGGNTKTLGGAAAVAGNLNIGTSTTFAAGANNFSVTGDWSNDGIYTATGAQTVTFNKSGTQTVGGAASTTFRTLALATGSQLSLAASANYPVNLFTVNSVTQGAGTWGSTSSTATAQNNTFFASTTGILTVATGVGPAVSLAFTTQPGGGTGGTAWTTQPVVTVKDFVGNTVTGSSASVTLAITGGTPATGGPGTFTATVNPLAATSGVATFAGGKIDKSGTGYQLTATSSGLTSATSSTFDIAVGTASKLAFTTQPGGGTGGTAWSTQPIVTVQDAGGNTVTGSSASITLAITGGTPGTGGPGTFSATVNPLAASSGIAAFAGAKINTAGTGYSLTATSSGLTSAVSSTFDITVGAAAKLAFTAQPGGGTGGIAWGTQPIVTVQDAGGNTVTGSSASITLAITGGTPATGGPGTFSATVNPLAASSGIATFAGAKINTAGTGYSLTATSSGLTSAVSSTFNITVGAAANLAFGIQPSTTTAGSAISPAVTVLVRDAGGNTVTTDTSSVTIAGTSFTSSTVTVAAVAGVATFTNLKPIVAGSQTLTASDGALTGASSTAFTVNSAAFDHYTLSFETTGNVPTLVLLHTIPFYTVARSHDVYNNLITTDTGTVVTFSVDAPSVTKIEWDGNADGTFDAGNPNTAHRQATSSAGVTKILTLGDDVAAFTFTETATSSLGTGSITASVTEQNGSYRSASSGNWNTASTWQTYNGSSWVTAGSPPSGATGLTVDIRSPHAVTTQSGDTITVVNAHVEAGATLTFAAGSTVTASYDLMPGLEVDGLLVNNTTFNLTHGTGIVVLVVGDGIIRNAGVVTTTGSDLTFFGGNYQHNYTSSAGTIPTASWQTDDSGNDSTCEVIGYTSSTGTPSGLNQSFQKFIWNSTSQTGDINLGAGFTSAKVLTVTSTGTGKITLGANLAVTTSATVQTGARLDTSTQVISGPAFTLDSGGILGIGSPDGITSSGATGNIRTTARTFSTGGNYVYNGTAGQAAGNGLPATVNSLRDDNTAGTLTLGQAETITTSLALATGAQVSLPASTTSSAATFTVNGVGKGSGSWGSTSSTATHKNNTYFAGTTGLLNVTTGVPSSFSSLTASQSITYGASSITLSGTISASGPIYPANGETITVTINGSSPTTTTTGGTGSFSISFPTASIPHNGGTPYTIQYAYGGNDDLNPATDTSTTLTVNRKGLDITADADSKTYGQTKTYGAGSTAFTPVGLIGIETIGSVTITASGGTAANDLVTTYTLTPSAATGGTFVIDNYTVTYHTGTLTVNPLAVSISGSRFYDGTSTAAAAVLSVANNIDGVNLTLSGSVTLTDLNLGSQPITSFAGLTLGGSAAGNYTKTGATGSVTISGTKTDAATTTITVANASNFDLTVNNGILLANNTPGSSLNGTGIIHVNSGGTLGGSGQVGGVEINSGGILSPGNSPGTLAAGPSTWATGGSYTWQINDAAGTAGGSTGWDLLAITGGLDITATSGTPFTINVTSLTAGNVAGFVPNFNPLTTYTWHIASVSTSVTGFVANKFTINATGFQNFTGGGTFSIEQNSTFVDLVFTPRVCVFGDVTSSWTTSGETIRITLQDAYGLSKVKGLRYSNMSTVLATAYDGADAALETDVALTQDVLHTFPFGTVKVIVVGTRASSSFRASLNAQAYDLCDSFSATIDPVITQLTVGDSGETRQTFTDIPSAEHYVIVQNATPGLSKLSLLVNGQSFVLSGLKDGEIRTLDIASAMVPGENNTVVLIGVGIPGSSAEITIGDSPTGEPTAAVVTPIALRVDRSGDTLQLSWPEAGSGLELQSQTELGPVGSWEPWPEAPTLQNGRYGVTVPAGTGANLFRLHKP